MNPSPGDRDHQVLRERLGAYVLDGLDAAERDEVDAHLAGCPACRAELAAIAPLAQPLRAVDPDRVAPPGAPAPPAGFDQVLRRVREESHEAPAPVVPLAPRRRAGRTGLLVAAGAVVLAVAGGAAGYGLGVRNAQGPREPVAVQALVPGVEADAATVAHTWGVEVVLTARGFDAGRTYLVSVTGRDGRAYAAGAFVGTGRDEMVCRLNSPVLPRDAAGFVVTTGQGEEVLRSRFV
ncbi:zf-HC2 domain-containing protein [Actinomycetospora sp. NBRC 106378]|uniref:zf-HC2 domain-containing protein n=1 Tax=Actinomycetospora sp. NBRC 106378 TaxID=3032208 RepID=UPI0024A28614|nr:zf-HC2 domain-containing protein [Actinomycetospora sp. NBRC 106378]GLZ54782.1 hypothetical protein Acsp07_43990 [Actinomycetospora sp. NBRC 106378]